MKKVLAWCIRIIPYVILAALFYALFINFSQLTLKQAIGTLGVFFGALAVLIALAWAVDWAQHVLRGDE